MAQTPRTPSAPKSPARLREDRLKAALKANLARRKAQARARAAQASDGETDKPGKTGGT